MTTRLAVAIGLSAIEAGCLGTARVPPAEDIDPWRFTPAEHAARNGSLTVADDSAWMPAPLRSNLTTFLDWALDPTLTPPVTDGVSPKDLFHGHLVFRRPCPTELIDAITERIEATNLERSTALGGNPFLPLTDQNLPAYRKIRGSVERLAASLAERFCPAGRPECAVIYHSYERNAPISILPTDSRRNLVFRFGDFGPRRMAIRPPPLDGLPKRVLDDLGVNNYLYRYCSLFQFVFLIDAAGEIHATAGGVRELALLMDPGAPLPVDGPGVVDVVE